MQTQLIFCFPIALLVWSGCSSGTNGTNKTDTSGLEETGGTSGCSSGPSGVWAVDYGDQRIACTNGAPYCGWDVPQDHLLNVRLNREGTVTVDPHIKSDLYLSHDHPIWGTVWATWDESACRLSVNWSTDWESCGEWQCERAGLELVIDGDRASGYVDYAGCGTSTLAPPGRFAAEATKTASLGTCDPTGTWLATYNGQPRGCEESDDGDCEADCMPVDDTITVSLDTDGNLEADTGRSTPTDTCGGEGNREVRVHFNEASCTLSIYEASTWCDETEQCDYRLLTFDASQNTATGVLQFHHCGCSESFYDASLSR